MKAKFTKQQIAAFRSYVRVQKSCRWNMSDPAARIATGLSGERYGFVMDNYEQLEKAAAKAKS